MDPYDSPLRSPIVVPITHSFPPKNQRVVLEGSRTSRLCAGSAEEVAQAEEPGGFFSGSGPVKALILGFWGFRVEGF